MGERDVVVAAIAYEVAWNRYRGLLGDPEETRLDKARTHQVLLDAVREYNADRLSRAEEARADG